MDKGRAALAKKVMKKKEEMNNDNSNNNENNNNNNNNKNRKNDQIFLSMKKMIYMERQKIAECLRILLTIFSTCTFNQQR